MKKTYTKGQIINGFTFIEEVEPYIKPNGRKHRKGKFKHPDGSTFITRIDKVRVRKESSKSSITHKLSGHPLYPVWIDLRRRCVNPNNKRYKDYGGRGIKVCNEWMKDFRPFYNWAIGNGYGEGLLIDREDNDGDYTPRNCRFVTPAVSSRNSRNVKLSMELAREIRDVKEMFVDASNSDIALEFGVCPGTIRDVLNHKTWKEQSQIF